MRVLWEPPAGRLGHWYIEKFSSLQDEAVAWSSSCRRRWAEEDGKGTCVCMRALVKIVCFRGTLGKVVRILTIKAHKHKNSQNNKQVALNCLHFFFLNKGMPLQFSVSWLLSDTGNKELWNIHRWARSGVERHAFKTVLQTPSLPPFWPGVSRTGDYLLCQHCFPKEAQLLFSLLAPTACSTGPGNNNVIALLPTPACLIWQAYWFLHSPSSSLGARQQGGREQWKASMPTGSIPHRRVIKMRASPHESTLCWK